MGLNKWIPILRLFPREKERRELGELLDEMEVY